MQESPCSSTVNTRQIRSGYLDTPHYESPTSPCTPRQMADDADPSWSTSGRLIRQLRPFRRRRIYENGLIREALAAGN